MIGPSASGVDEYGSCDCEPVSAGLPEVESIVSKRKLCTDLWLEQIEHNRLKIFDSLGWSMVKYT